MLFFASEALQKAVSVGRFLQFPDGCLLEMIDE